MDLILYKKGKTLTLVKRYKRLSLSFTGRVGLLKQNVKCTKKTSKVDYI